MVDLLVLVTHATLKPTIRKEGLRADSVVLGSIVPGCRAVVRVSELRDELLRAFLDDDAPERSPRCFRR